MISSINITGLDYDVDDKTRKYVLEKIGRLDKYVPLHERRSMTANVKLSQINNEHGNKYEVEVTVRVPDKVIAAQDSTMNMMAAVDIVEAKLAMQLRKYKETLLADRKATA